MVLFRHQPWHPPPLIEARARLVDVRQSRQACLVAEVLDRMRRGSASKSEIIVPGGERIVQVGIDVCAVKDIAGTVDIGDPLGRNVERRHNPVVAGPLIVKEAALSEPDDIEEFEVEF